MGMKYVQGYRNAIKSPASNASKQAANDPIFFIREVPMLYVRPQVVEPSQPATLSTPPQTCSQSKQILNIHATAIEESFSLPHMTS